VRAPPDDRSDRSLTRPLEGLREGDLEAGLQDVVATAEEDIERLRPELCGEGFASRSLKVEAFEDRADAFGDTRKGFLDFLEGGPARR